MTGYYSQHAVNLLRRGYEPIPEAPITRAALIEGWTTCDLDSETVARWASNGVGQGGIGARCGRLSVLDIDVQDERVVTALLRVVAEVAGDVPARRGQPPKVALMFRSPDPSRRKRTSTRWSDDSGKDHRIEVLGRGQKITLQSIHPDTRKPYQWSIRDVGSLPHIDELPELTDDLIDRMFRELDRHAERLGWSPKSGGSTAPLPDEFGLDADDLDGMWLATAKAPEGIGLEALRTMLHSLDPDMDRDSWVRVGMALHHECRGDSDGLEIWDAWSGGGAKYAGPDDTQRCWDSFGEREGQRLITVGYLRSLLLESSDVGAEVSGGPATDQPEDRFDTFDWSGLSVSTPPPEQLVEELFTVGALSLSSSQPNTGKSAFALDLAAHVAAGAAWRGRQVQQGTVLYIAAESPESVRARLLAMKSEREWGDIPLYVVHEPVVLTTPEARMAFARKIRAFKSDHPDATFFPLDTLRNATPGLEENDAKETGAVILFLDRLAKSLKIHFHIAHHTTKAGTSYAGSGMFGAVVDTELALSLGEGDDEGMVKAEVRQQRSLTSRGETYWYRIVSRATGRTTNFGKPETAPLVEHVLDADREFLKAERDDEQRQAEREEMDRDLESLVGAMLSGAVSRDAIMAATGLVQRRLAQVREEGVRRGVLVGVGNGTGRRYAVSESVQKTQEQTKDEPQQEEDWL